LAITWKVVAVESLRKSRERETFEFGGRQPWHPEKLTLGKILPGKVLSVFLPAF
jgi:hypothetical protein